MLFRSKQRRGRGVATPPLADFGPDPVTEKPVLMKDGRFGPYVTDGETNASLRRGDDPQHITAERAFELLAERRAAGPSPRAKKTAAKKTAAKPAKKATAKKASAKPAKKTAAKKTAVKPAKKAAARA